jgi:hemolysin activation/secretion protein
LRSRIRFSASKCHCAGFTFFTTANRPSELRSTEVLYETPVGSAGTRLSVSVARTDLKPGGSLAPQAIDGSAMRYTARITHPLIRSRDQSFWLAGTFEVLDSSESENHEQLFDDSLAGLARVGQLRRERRQQRQPCLY